MNVAFTDTGDIYIWDILRRVKEIFQISHPLLFFYYDYAQDTEVCLHTDDHTFIHHSSILKESKYALIQIWSLLEQKHKFPTKPSQIQS